MWSEVLSFDITKQTLEERLHSKPLFWQGFVPSKSLLLELQSRGVMINTEVMEQGVNIKESWSILLSSILERKIGPGSFETAVIEHLQAKIKPKKTKTKLSKHPRSKVKSPEPKQQVQAITAQHAHVPSPPSLPSIMSPTSAALQSELDCAVFSSLDITTADSLLGEASSDVFLFEVHDDCFDFTTCAESVCQESAL